MRLSYIIIGLVAGLFLSSCRGKLEVDPAPSPFQSVVVEVSDSALGASLGVMLLDSQGVALKNEALPKVGTYTIIAPKTAVTAMFYSPYLPEALHGLFQVDRLLKPGYSKVPIKDKRVSAPKWLTPLVGTLAFSFAKEVDKSALELKSLEGVVTEGVFDWRKENWVVEKKGSLPLLQEVPLLPQTIEGGVVELVYQGVPQKLTLPKVVVREGERVIASLSPQGIGKLVLHSYTIKDYDVKTTTWGFASEQ